MILLAMAKSVCWYGLVLRREDGHVLRRALDFDVEGQRKKGKRSWNRQVEEESVKVGLWMEDALFQSNLHVGINQIAAWLRWIWSPSLVWDTTRLLLDWGECGHPHLLEILPDCCFVEVNLVTLTCWGYCKIATRLRWIWSPSLVGDTTRLLLCWG